MQTIEYDLNISGGLMPQINALTAPPTSDESRSRKRLKKPIGRQNQLSGESNANVNHHNNRPILSRQTKTGKAPNHEYCDSCREGGDLLCCDRCPNAFHLQCHDPPLDEEDVPQGEWLCRKCEIVGKELYLSDDEDSDECEDVNANPKALQKPFSLLIKAAQTLNPKQFQLPNDMMPSIPLVGTSKKVSAKGKKQIQELDNNLQVSFPIQLCFQCSKSCRKAPLIQCDYCPLLYHADCLDPPLTALPTGRWMCPNHSQHVVEQKLLNSERLSERIKLWNHFNGPINQDTIKLDFLKKIHRTDPPFRTKVALPMSSKVVVPEAIKDMYRKRPPLLPTIYASNTDYNAIEEENSCKHEKPTPEQEREWLEAMLAFQSSAAQYLNSAKLDDIKAKPEPDSSLVAKTSDKDNELKVKDSSVKCNSITMNGPIDTSEDSSVKRSEESESKPVVDSKQMNGEKDSPTTPEKQISLKNHFNVQSIEDLNRLDETTIKMLAFQHLRQQNSTKTPDNTTSPIAAQSLSSSSPYQTTIRRIGLHDVRARAVLCPIIHVKSSAGSTTGYSLMSYRTLTIGTSCDNDVVLGEYGHCNYVSAKHACIFYDETSRTYELINYSEHGTTVDNVLYSCDFSDKKIQSVKHSTLNSQTVSTVKSVAKKRQKKSAEENRSTKLKNFVSSDDTSDKRQTKRRKSAKGEEVETNAQTLSGLKTNKILFRLDNDSENVERVVNHPRNPPTMSSKSGQIQRPCACKSSCSSLIGANGAGWEGTAILHHGSHIKIGCHQFIFSITNHGIGQNATNPSAQPKSPIKAEPSTTKSVDK